MIVGLPLSAGSTSCGSDGAFWPVAGDGEVLISSGESHDENSWERLILRGVGSVVAVFLRSIEDLEVQSDDVISEGLGPMLKSFGFGPLRSF